MALERGPLLADDSLRGAAWCRAHSRLVDNWLRGLLAQAVGSDGAGVALVAVGGYGREELCPQSDIDVMLVHDRRSDIAKIADRIWYPIWDEALHLGHSVCTLREALALAADDLDTATAVLSARVVAGDSRLAEQLAESGREQWRHRSRRWLALLAARVDERHEAAGEVAFRLEPDLKEGRGGLRDVHSLQWAEAASQILLERDNAALTSSYAVLLDARVELQRITQRPNNVLALQEQPAVARSLGDKDADQLMARVAAAARAIAWMSDDTWRRINATLRGPLGRVVHRSRQLEPGISLRDGEIVIADDHESEGDATFALRVATHAARHRAPIERHSLEQLAHRAGPMPDPWPPRARESFSELLLEGRAAVPLIESLDQRGVWTHVLPEWAPVQSRPQRNPYHRFTVDRHLLETAVHAAALVDRVARPDLLVIGALIHDLGKGYPGDHTRVGVDLAVRLGTRMGYPDEDVATLASLVEHHLLLPDVATRRDLDDPETVKRVAAAVGSNAVLQLLAALTEADGLATGPAAWGPSKARLVTELVRRVAQLLQGDEATPAAVQESFPTAAQLAALAEPGDHIEGAGHILTVMTDDRPGVFSRVAGVVSLHGLDVQAAAAYSSDDGRALAQFNVTDPYRDVTPWDKINADLLLALDGRLAVDARVAARARTYDRGRPRALPTTSSVAFHNDASGDATVIDVHTTDGIGVLYRITKALAELDLDIRAARVQTLGHEVVDAFYVRTRHGTKIDDRHHQAETEQAILHALRD